GERLDQRGLLTIRRVAAEGAHTHRLAVAAELDWQAQKGGGANQPDEPGHAQRQRARKRPPPPPPWGPPARRPPTAPQPPPPRADAVPHKRIGQLGRPDPEDDRG